MLVLLVDSWVVTLWVCGRLRILLLWTSSRESWWDFTQIQWLIKDIIYSFFGIKTFLLVKISTIDMYVSVCFLPQPQLSLSHLTLFTFTSSFLLLPLFLFLLFLFFFNLLFFLFFFFLTFTSPFLLSPHLDNFFLLQPTGLLAYLDSSDPVPEKDLDRMHIRDNLKIASVNLDLYFDWFIMRNNFSAY